MKNILIRCDGSKEIGLGHVTRCLVLANKFRILGYNVIFAMKDYKVGLEKIKKEKFLINIAPEIFDYFKWMESCIKEYKIDAFIGDVRDGLSLEVIQDLKKQSILTIAIDEPSDYAKECDLCFYPPHARIDQTLYKGKVYQGLEYVPLREEFYKEFKKIKKKTPNILIMLGGTDPNNLTLRVVSSLLEKNINSNIKVILNEKHPNYRKLNTLSKRVSLYSNIENVAKFLQDIDFAVITFGMTAYELLLMGIHSVHICLDEDHYSSSNYFVKNGFANRVYYDQLDLIEISFKENIDNFKVENKILNRIENEIV